MTEKRFIRVLMVCMGNICRSPTAEGVFRAHVEAAGLGDIIDVDSAGTHGFHIGRAPDRRAQEAATARGIDISGLRARQVDSYDFEAFDYILAMDEANYGILVADAPPSAREHIHRFLSFAADRPESEVPDPYYGGGDGFEHVFDLVDEASAGLLTAIRRDHGL
ncbi:Low molecular weight protein-tyrosine-phosphatase YfkJ [wastewater metagenome]|uniref:protein-tyrosine-phosphatase n=2 Tax=unclassified sequences TaxID=12908 RepID=A0A5B8RFJ5_9ZZZZ|nr:MULTISPECIES: low molecular weight protein-tyrosine-phosphatase [Arhodomonas]QEA05605.1 low molecular weight protein-tyrosine-phosphatase YfkJ [uncultured organism]